MARYKDARCRLCRRQGEKLYLKGIKCGSQKCTLIKRPTPPGQHARSRSKPSNYGLQLREKQKVKWMYGVLEKQFRRYFKIAEGTKGVTGRILLQLLERRIDNVIYRMGLGSSRAQARQIVRHNMVCVNSRRMNIPSHMIVKDDIVEIKAKDGGKKKIKENLELSKERTVPAWIEFDATAMKAKVVRLPEKEDIPAPIQEQLIVELYSK